MKISQEELDDISFERVHRIPTKATNNIDAKPRPIIAKVSFYQDKEFIKSHIKHLKKGAKFGVADDFSKEVDDVRKALQPVFKKAKQDQRTAFFNVEKLIIDREIYQGPETKKFSFYGKLMESGNPIT